MDMRMYLYLFFLSEFKERSKDIYYQQQNAKFDLISDNRLFKNLDQSHNMKSYLLSID